MAFGATYTTAQSAWAADAFGGVFTSSQVAADRRQQSADWVKITTTSRTTSRKQREPHALTEAQTEIEQLKLELKQVESAQKAMHEGGRAGTRGSKQSNDQEKTKGRNKDGWRDRCCACVLVCSVRAWLPVCVPSCVCVCVCVCAQSVTFGIMWRLMDDCLFGNATDKCVCCNGED